MQCAFVTLYYTYDGVKRKTTILASYQTSIKHLVTFQYQYIQAGESSGAVVSREEGLVSVSVNPTYLCLSLFALTRTTSSPACSTYQSKIKVRICLSVW
jgi:hypothetical protein